MIDGDPYAFSSHWFPDAALGRFRSAQTEDSSQNPAVSLGSAFLAAITVVPTSYGHPAATALQIWAAAFAVHCLRSYYMFQEMLTTSENSKTLPKEYTHRGILNSLWFGAFWGCAALVGFAGIPMSAIAPFAIVVVMSWVGAVMLAATQMVSVVSLVAPILSGAWIGLALNRGEGALTVAFLLAILAVFSFDLSAHRTFHLARRVLDHYNAECAARTDALTGLGNRIAFEERLESAIEAVERDRVKAALLMFDLDGLKRINDSYGHAVGDRLIRRMGDVLRSRVGAAGFAARLGGDEFVVILNVAKRQDALRAAIAIARAFAEPANIGFGLFSPSTSVGVAIAPDDALDATGLAQAADAAMYRHKSRITETNRLREAS